MQRENDKTNQELSLKQSVGCLAVLVVLLAIGLGWFAKSQSDARHAIEKQRTALVQKQRDADTKRAQIQSAKFRKKHKGKKMAYNVNDAGTTAANTLYADDGTLNGKGHYLASNGYGISWDGSQWGIYSNTSDLLYSNSSDTSNPPETGWSVAFGVSPAPTVTLAGVAAIIKPTAFKVGDTVTIASSAPADGSTDEVYAAADTGLTTSLATVTLTEVTPTLDAYQYTFVAPSLSPGDYFVNHVMTLTQIPLDFRIYVARRKNRILN